MATEEVYEFLEKCPNVKFMAMDVAGALDVNAKQIHKAMRKLTDKKNIHYDTHIKREKGHCRKVIHSYVNDKTYTSNVPVLYIWFETKEGDKSVKRQSRKVFNKK